MEWLKTPVNTRINKSVWLNSQTCFFCGGEKSKQGYIYFTSDAGISWTKVYNSTNSLYDIFFVNESIGYVGGENMELLKTEDGGQTWKPMSRFASSDKFFNGTLYGLYGNENVVLAVGGNSYNVGIVNRIIGGYIIPDFRGAMNELRCGAVFKPFGYLTLGYGTAFKTTDSAKTISPVELEKEFFTSCSSLDTDVSFACGYNGGVYKLTQQQNKISCENLSDKNHFYKKRVNWNGICFTNATHGIVVGNNGNVMITEDGKNFNFCELNTDVDLLSVSFNQSDAFVISTSNGKLIRVYK